MSGPFRIGDMVRSMITVATPEEAILAFKLIRKNFKIIRIKNKLLDPLQLIHLNVIYANAIIGEI